MAAVLRHPHLRRLTIHSPSGPIALPAPPAQWLGEPAPSFGPLPALGAHSEEVRREFLGSADVTQGGLPGGRSKS
jgi:formyl-CoA transferase